MKDFILKVLLPVFFSITSLLIMGEVILRSFPNDFKMKNDYMEANAREIKTLVLGASTTSMGIIPSCLTLQPAFSCAYADQNIEYDNYIFNKFITEMDSLKMVILDMNYVYLWNHETKPGRNAEVLIRQYNIYYGCSDYMGWNYNFEMSNNFFQLLPKKMNPDKNRNAIFRTCASDGFQGEYFVTEPYDEEKWKKSGFSSAAAHTGLFNEDIGGKMLNNSLSLIEDIVSQCMKRNITVCAISLPVTHHYFDNFDESQYSTILTCMKKIEEEYPNFHYLNQFNNSEFSNNDFSNPNHLNPSGAVKFTKLLDENIQNYI